MDIDSEYAKFMSELEASPAKPSAGPSHMFPPAAPPPSMPPPPMLSPSRTLPPHHQAHALPSILPPRSAPPPLAAPPDRPPANILPPPPALQPPSAPPGTLPGPPPPQLPPVARPAGPPPPISARPEPAVLSAPAQLAALPPPTSIAPPTHAPPSMQSHHTSAQHYSYPNVPNQQAFNPALLDPEMLREEILSEKKDSKRKKKPKDGVMRAAGGETWIDDKMDVWPANDFRIFVGNLGPEVNEDILAKSFNQFPSFAKCRIVKDYKKNKAKGYGFVSFTDHPEGVKALKQMNGKYIGNRPCQLKKSTHDIRNVPTDAKKRRAMLANPLERITTRRMR